jgi:hypothetical protein
MKGSTKVKQEIVFYCLLPKDRPVSPDRVWSGRVIAVEGSYLLVESTEPGYEGLREIISKEQVQHDRYSDNGTRLAK